MDLPNFQLSDPLIDSGRNNVVCRPVVKGGILTVSAGLINCTGSYSVSQADMNAGTPITNVATVSFSSVPSVASQSANVTTTILQQPSLSVTKEADRFTADAAGQVITYEIIITNTG